MPSLGSLTPRRSRVISHRRLNHILQSVTHTLTAEIVDQLRHKRIAWTGHDNGNPTWEESPPGLPEDTP